VISVPDVFAKVICFEKNILSEQSPEAVVCLRFIVRSVILVKQCRSVMLLLLVVHVFGKLLL